MNTHSEPSTGSAARLRSVQDLISNLDQMRTDGVGARERLDFLLAHSAEIVPEFDFHDALSLEHVATSVRVRKLEDLGDQVVKLKGLWADSPLADDVRGAGQKLMRHLEGFVAERKSAETRNETQMLAELWDWGPDLSDLYPWLSSWAGRPKKEKAPAHDIPEEARELTAQRDDLAHEVAGENLATTELLRADGPEKVSADVDRWIGSSIARDFLEPPSSEAPEGTPPEPLEQEASGQPSPEPSPFLDKFPFRGPRRPETDPAGDVVARLTPDEEARPLSSLSGPQRLPASFSAPDARTSKRWTAALADHLGGEWAFASLEHRLDRLTMCWTCAEGNARLEVLPSEHGVLAMLRVLLDGRIKRANRTLAEDGLAQFFAEPDALLKALADG